MVGFIENTAMRHRWGKGSDRNFKAVSEGGRLPSPEKEKIFFAPVLL